MRTTVTLLALALGAALAGAIMLFSGTYDIAATVQHYAPTYWALQIGMRRSVETHARSVKVPPLDDPALARQGLALYHAHCVRCHGAPGVPPEPFALGLTPAPANLSHTAREWPAAELYWTIKNGIKMTGMPAWEFRLAEDDLWAIVAFARRLPQLSPQQYAAEVRALGSKSLPVTSAPVVNRPGDATRGKVAIQQYACATCHVIPGITGAIAPVGPPLERIAARTYIGGVLMNTPENMVRWLRQPQTLDPGTAMPDLGVSERDARDITAYLYTLQ
jgi:mono/diheme cytochrome c family protein